MHIETLHDVRSNGHGLVVICRHPTCRHRQSANLDRLINSVGRGALLLPGQSELHFTDKMRCQSCKRRGVNLWVDAKPPKLKALPPAQKVRMPNYRVLDLGKSHPYTESMIATADNLMVARAAFAAAAHFYGDHWIMLMQGAYVVEDNKRDGQPRVMLAEEYRLMREVEAGRADGEELLRLANLMDDAAVKAD